MSYVLNATTLPSPNKFNRQQVYVKTDSEMIDGKSKRDIATGKEMYVLEWNYLSKGEMAIIDTIIALNTAVTFSVSEQNLTIGETNVLPLLIERVHSVSGSDYLGKVVLELKEVT